MFICNFANINTSTWVLFPCCHPAGSMKYEGQGAVCVEGARENLGTRQGNSVWLTGGYCQILDSLKINELHVHSLLSVKCVIQPELTISPNKYLWPENNRTMKWKLHFALWTLTAVTLYLSDWSLQDRVDLKLKTVWEQKHQSKTGSGWEIWSNQMTTL